MCFVLLQNTVTFVNKYYEERTTVNVLMFFDIDRFNAIFLRQSLLKKFESEK